MVREAGLGASKVSFLGAMLLLRLLALASGNGDAVGGRAVPVASACPGRAGPSASPQLVQLVGNTLQLSLNGGQALQLLVLQRKHRTQVSSHW